MSSEGATTATKSPEKEAARQVEFYLSDSNLPFDKYLFSLWGMAHKELDGAIEKADAIEPRPSEDSLTVPEGIRVSKEKIGWIPLEKLTSFKRMQPFMKSSEEGGLGGIEGVANALAENTSGKLQVAFVKTPDSDEGKWFVRRSTDLTRPADPMARSIYAKGFPVPEGEGAREAEQKLQKDIEDWLRSLGVGELKSVRMRREADAQGRVNRGPFKGSIFAEFDSPESAKAVLALDPKTQLVWEEKPLETMSKVDYVEMKKKKYEGVESENNNKRGNKKDRPFNAWLENLLEPSGYPIVSKISAPVQFNNKKRKNPDEPETKEFTYDGIVMQAKKLPDGKIEVEGLEEQLPKVGKNKLLQFTIDAEEGKDMPKFDFNFFKTKLRELAPVAFVDLISDANDTSSPAKAQASFKETISDDVLEKISNSINSWEDHTVSWIRPEDNAVIDHARPRVIRAAEQAFVKPERNNRSFGKRQRRF